MPVVLVGGATGLVGDPSGKSKERNLLTEETLQHNLAGIRAQLGKFIDLDGTRALLVNSPASGESAHSSRLRGNSQARTFDLTRTTANSRKNIRMWDPSGPTWVQAFPN